MLGKVDKIDSVDSRKALAKMVIKLFCSWDLNTADQLTLLGLSCEGEAIMQQYVIGEALPESRETLNRVGWLLTIHKALGMLYPYNKSLRYHGGTEAITALRTHYP